MSKLTEDLERMVTEHEQRLLDHFAGLVVVSLVANKEYNNSVGELNSQLIANKSYEIAKAMLKARKESNP